ncbi:MAG: hypothetical protein MJ010_07655 [Paludibacteraceae bacterium]|nr:hypothetical protein [Paludibacteraceae bacterium]
MKKYTLIICIALSAVLCGCVEEESGSYWGETTYYNDFLWKKHEPVKMEQTLVFDFNEDAQRLLQDAVFSFEVVERNAEGEFVPATDIALYANGVKCESNVFKITVKDKELPLCVIFNDDAREGNHTLFLRELGDNSLSRVEYTELGDGFVVKKTDCINPLKLGLTWFLIVIACLLLLWIIVLRYVFFPRFSVKKLNVSSGDNYKTINLRGVHKVVFTIRKCSQNSLAGFFTGKIIYITNDFFSRGDVVVSHRDKKSVRIKAAKYLSSGGRLQKGEQYEISKEGEKEKIIMTI